MNNNKIINTSIQIVKENILTVVECINGDLFYSLGRFRKGYSIEEEYKTYVANQFHWQEVIDIIGFLGSETMNYDYCIYDMSDTSTIFQRVTYICEMHKARWRANQYYWEQLKKIKGIIPEMGELQQCTGCSI